MKITRGAFFFALFSLGAITVANSATVTVNQTADLTGLCSPSDCAAGSYFNNGAPNFSNDGPVSVTVGDTLKYNLDFIGNQQVTVTGLAFFAPLLITVNQGQSALINMTGVLSFLDTSGNVIYSTPSFTNSDGSVHIGQFFSSFPGLPSIFSFGGISYTGTLNSSSGLATRSYDGEYFLIRAQTVSVTAVPGPIVGAGLPGLMIGLGGLVMLSRRRRNQAAVS